MYNKSESRFIEEIKIFEEGRVVNIYNALVELYSTMTCNCFLNSQKQLIYKNLLNTIENIEDDSSNFHLSLVKGFVYLRNNNEKAAYKYLTNSIELDDSIDLAYSIRALIKPEINSAFSEDAKNAVLLNPSARNYFVLANSFDKKDEKDLQKSILFFEKAIELQPDFACAFNNRAIRFLELKKINNAINDFKRCVEIDPNHWAYDPLLRYLDNQGRYYEALKYAKLATKYHPSNERYLFRLGIFNARLEYFDAAIYHFQKYLRKNHKNFIFRNKL